MKFNSFLKYLKDKEKLTSATALYMHLGGERHLKIGQRNFLQLYSGSRQPSFEVFTKVIEKLPTEEFKAALIAYLKGFEVNSKGAISVIDYIQENLSIKIDKKTPDVWDVIKDVKVLNENQLNYLNDNPEAMRFLDLLVLKEKLSLNFFKGKAEIIKNLEKLGLLEIVKGNEIRRPFQGLKVPTQVNSPSPIAIKGIKHIKSKIDNYSTSENNPDQKFIYSLQSIKKEHLPHILDQLTTLDKWIRSLAEMDDHFEDNMPFVFVSFARGLSWSDF
jgi:hypothetical protein